MPYSVERAEVLRPLVHLLPAEGRTFTLLWPVWLHRVSFARSSASRDDNPIRRAVARLQAQDVNDPDAIAHYLKLKPSLVRRVLEESATPLRSRGPSAPIHESICHVLRDGRSQSLLPRFIGSAPPRLASEATDSPERRQLPRKPGRPERTLRVLFPGRQPSTEPTDGEIRDQFETYRRHMKSARQPLEPPFDLSAPRLQVLAGTPDLWLVPVSLIPAPGTDEWTVWDPLTQMESTVWRRSVGAAARDLPWLNREVERISSGHRDSRSPSSSLQSEDVSVLAAEELERRCPEYALLSSGPGERIQEFAVNRIREELSDFSSETSTAALEAAVVVEATLTRLMSKWAPGDTALQWLDNTIDSASDLEDRLTRRTGGSRIVLPQSLRRLRVNSVRQCLATNGRGRPGLHALLCSVAVSAGLIPDHPLNEVLAQNPESLTLLDRLRRGRNNLVHPHADRESDRQLSTEDCWMSVRLSVLLLTVRRERGRTSQ